MSKKRCAVCGDTTALNVRLAWRRDRDRKTVNICCACAEAGAVNENSIDNYTTADTLYTGSVETEKKQQATMGSHYKKSSAFAVTNRAKRH